MNMLWSSHNSKSVSNSRSSPLSELCHREIKLHMTKIITSSINIQNGPIQVLTYYTVNVFNRTMSHFTFFTKAHLGWIAKLPSMWTCHGQVTSANQCPTLEAHICPNIIPKRDNIAHDKSRLYVDPHPKWSDPRLNLLYGQCFQLY